MKLGIEQYKSFLDELAKSKKVDPAEMKKKMANCGPPGVSAGAGGVSIVNWNINPKVYRRFQCLVTKQRQGTGSGSEFIPHVIDDNKFLSRFHKSNQSRNSLYIEYHVLACHVIDTEDLWRRQTWPIDISFLTMNFKFSPTYVRPSS